MKELKDYVLTIPDFPEPGVMFRDITSVLQDADGLRLAIDEMQELVKDVDFDVVAGAESRGFCFGAPIAYNLHKPLVLIRKKGKVDDLIATGGTNLAMAHLIESLGGEIAGVVVLMELAGLKGREKLGKYPLYSALTYEGK